MFTPLSRRVGSRRRAGRQHADEEETDPDQCLDGTDRERGLPQNRHRLRRGGDDPEESPAGTDDTCRERHRGQSTVDTRFDFHGTPPPTWGFSSQVGTLFETITPRDLMGDDLKKVGKINRSSPSLSISIIAPDRIGLDFHFFLYLLSFLC